MTNPKPDRQYQHQITNDSSQNPSSLSSHRRCRSQSPRNNGEQPHRQTQVANSQRERGLQQQPQCSERQILQQSKLVSNYKTVQPNTSLDKQKRSQSSLNNLEHNSQAQRDNSKGKKRNVSLKSGKGRTTTNTMNTSFDNKPTTQSNTALLQKLVGSSGKGTKIIKEAGNSSMSTQRSRNYKFKVTTSNSK